MPTWTNELEEELALFLKDWLKQQGKTQADLRRSLQATSTRMPALIEVLQKEFSQGGLPNLVARLCCIEENWSKADVSTTKNDKSVDPFGQLDLLLEELREDIES